MSSPRKRAAPLPVSSDSLTAFDPPGTGPPGRTSIRAAYGPTRPTTRSCGSSSTGCLPDPGMVQRLPAEPERRLVLRGVVVQGDDQDAVDDVPQGAQREP